MGPHAYTEDQLVEQPAIGLFAELGWQTVSAKDESFGAGGTGSCNLGRETKGEVVLVDRLRAALTKLNPGLPAEAIQTAGPRPLGDDFGDRQSRSLSAAEGWYANVFASLERALAIYGAGKGGANPVKDKAQLVAALREAVTAVTAYCSAIHLEAGHRRFSGRNASRL